MDEISWVPTTKDSASFNTMSLAREENRISLEPNAGSALFGFFFIMMGVVGTFAFLGLIEIESSGPMIVFPLFIVVGFYIILRDLNSKMVFDKTTGKVVKVSFYKSVELELCKLIDISFVQLLEKEVEGTESYYDSYEVNLALDSGRRLNIWVSGKLPEVKKDAMFLAEFLEVPLLEGL